MVKTALCAIMLFVITSGCGSKKDAATATVSSLPSKISTNAK